MSYICITIINSAMKLRLDPNSTQPLHQQAEELLLRMVDQALGNYGLSAKKVTADMDIAADGSISMGQITVYVDARTAVRSVAVAQIASARLGAPVTVALWEED